ncbi:MMPL family protein [Halovenus aranensis]|uniref:MMPL family protein n=1 Tax=Halovenus aranensis TaxID=890420 RepID=A0A1G8UZ07_9EURY|nr:MMPL family transporter [Halovenus aranensis]SDJ58335.1 MMPL family protein [Halovenus aranensis]
MIRRVFDRLVDLVTTHNRVVILVMVLLTAGMVVGMGQLDTESQAEQDDLFPETAASTAADYIEENYRNDNQTAVSAVYVRDQSGNALSKGSLLESIEYQQAVLDNDSVAGTLVGEPHSIASAVATTLAGEGGSLDEQRATLDAASAEAVENAIEATLSADDSDLLGLLPDSYEPGTASAESTRLLFQFASEEGPPSDAQHALFAEAGGRPGYFTLGEHAASEASAQLNENTMQLVVPIALVLVLGVLAVTYRNIVDVIVGLVGVLVSVLWMFGILGWLGIGAGMTMIIGPVLITGLSIDFSFHVFNRYREQRGPDDGIRESMNRGVRSVAVALGLVTVTAAIGFLSNVVNPVGTIRNLGVGITLGVASALVVFTTLVPALKISIDGTLERVGIDRHADPLGHGALVGPALRSAVVLAKRAAPVVLVVAVIAGAAGGVAWTTLDEENFQQQTEPAAEWKQQLPGPLAWEDPEFNRNQQYVQSSFSAVAADQSARFQLLVEGDVTADDALDTVSEATGSGAFTPQNPSTERLSPMTVIRSVAAEDADFAETVADADTNGDGVPDTGLETVYDHLYAVAPERAGQVVERADGEYRSLRAVGPAESAGFGDDRTEDIQAMAADIDAQHSALTATAVSNAIVMDAGLDEVTDGILRVLVLALAAVSAGLVVVFRSIHDSAAVGAVTALPITLVTGLVVGGMAVLDVPLTLLTALLMSLVVGLGIDYNIHITDRFLQELDHGQSGFDALETAVTGTGGALFGSALSSGGAFLALLIHPHPQIESFGLLVVLALFAAFLVSVFVLPSALALWWHHSGTEPQPAQSTEPAATD